jgi:hypothetical protein
VLMSPTDSRAAGGSQARMPSVQGHSGLAERDNKPIDVVLEVRTCQHRLHILELPPGHRGNYAV